MNVQFINNLSAAEPSAGSAHDHGDGNTHSHSHDGPGDHGLTPTSTSRMQVRMSICPHATSGADPRAGKYSERDLPDYSARNFEERGFTVGIGGCVAIPRCHSR